MMYSLYLSLSLCIQLHSSLKTNDDAAAAAASSTQVAQSPEAGASLSLRTAYEKWN